MHILLDANQPTGWIVLGSIVAGLIALVNRLFDSKYFREEVLETVGELRQRDEAQEARINRLLGRIVELESQAAHKDALLNTQQELKHACRSRLQTACVCIELYRRAHGQHDDDSLDMSEWMCVESLKDNQ